MWSRSVNLSKRRALARMISRTHAVTSAFRGVSREATVALRTAAWAPPRDCLVHHVLTRWTMTSIGRMIGHARVSAAAFVGRPARPRTPVLEPLSLAQQELGSWRGCDRSRACGHNGFGINRRCQRRPELRWLARPR